MLDQVLDDRLSTGYKRPNSACVRKETHGTRSRQDRRTRLLHSSKLTSAGAITKGKGTRLRHYATEKEAQQRERVLSIRLQAGVRLPAEGLRALHYTVSHALAEMDRVTGQGSLSLGV